MRLRDQIRVAAGVVRRVVEVLIMRWSFILLDRELLDAFLGDVCLPVGNRRYSRLAVCATSVTPIANRLYRGLPVRSSFGVFRLASRARGGMMVEPCERDAFIWYWLPSES